MPYEVNWGETPAYTRYVERHGSDDGFVQGNGTPQFPLGGVMWRMLIANVHSITPSNVAEVFGRIALYEDVHEDPIGFSVGDDGKKESVRTEPWHVAVCVGMSANIREMNRAEWCRYFADISKDNGKWTVTQVRKRLDEYVAHFNETAVASLVEDTFGGE